MTRRNEPVVAVIGKGSTQVRRRAHGAIPAGVIQQAAGVSAGRAEDLHVVQWCPRKARVCIQNAADGPVPKNLFLPVVLAVENPRGPDPVDFQVVCRVKIGRSPFFYEEIIS